MLDRPDVTLTIRLPQELSQLLDKTAKDYDLTRGELIRRALSDYLSAPATPTDIYAPPKAMRQVLT
jgi:predicted transcriptional regulator